VPGHVIDDAVHAVSYGEPASVPPSPAPASPPPELLVEPDPLPEPELLVEPDPLPEPELLVEPDPPPELDPDPLPESDLASDPALASDPELPDPEPPDDPELLEPGLVAVPVAQQTAPAAKDTIKVRSSRCVIGISSRWGTKRTLVYTLFTISRQSF
jgi:hypothetical protein